MRLRIVDYVANAGGGVRYALQLLSALTQACPQLQIELVSHGDALGRYRSLLNEDCITRDVPPTQAGWCFELPAQLLCDCDHLWLPWIHRHSIPAGCDAARVTATFHDAILFDHADLFRDVVSTDALAQECSSIDHWLASNANIAITAHATVNTLNRLFQAEPRRFQVIPISGDHARHAPSDVRPEWSFAHKPFLLCPANICPHKNHETLFHAFARWGQRHPLVLTGQATHLHLCQWERAVELKRLAEQLNIPLGATLHTLGYLPDAGYYALLQRAWALVMPTLAEGGGSFPVAEALHLGIPVLCSDIPPVREQVERMNGRVIWFNPRDPSDLAAKLDLLECDYAHYKSEALQRMTRLRRRSWHDVAEEYLRLFRRTADNTSDDGLAHVGAGLFG